MLYEEDANNHLDMTMAEDNEVDFKPINIDKQDRKNAAKVIQQ